MRNDNPGSRSRKLTLASLAVLALVALSLAGCEDEDTIVYVEDGPPAVPTGVYTITGDEWVEVRWNPVYDDDVAGYGVYRSLDADGAYSRLATLRDPVADSYVDTGVTNGVTYYYAVDAFDHRGRESDLSYELAFDTPRPAGEDVTLWARQIDPTRCAIDFADWNDPADFVTSHLDAGADVVFQRVNGLLYAVGTVVGGIPNDIQDLGYTESMDDVSWAPGQGWSVSPDGVELIEGHTYVVWTWNEYFAKFRVVSLNDPLNPSSALIDWAYQTDQFNPELQALAGREKSRTPEGRDS